LHKHLYLDNGCGKVLPPPKNFESTSSKHAIF
jgi:hypothetical protein